MAENENKAPLTSGDNENFMRSLSKALSRIEKIDKATVSANDSLKNYAESFNLLNKELDKFEKTARNIKASEKNGLIFNFGGGGSGSGSGGGSGSGRSGSSNNKNSKADKAGKFVRGAKGVAKGIKKGNISDVASQASSVYSALGAKAMIAVGAVGVLAAVVGVLSKVTLEAQKNTASYTRSLIQMGVQLNRLEKGSISTANEVNKLSNRWENTVQKLGETLKPVLDIFVSLGNFLLGFADDSESKKKKYGAQAEIVSDARQSGFSGDSARALAGGTYEQALKLGEKYGQQASEVASKLADAWLTGSDAAKEYGIVVNDYVLTGYMASQGVDIANVEITDAMKQYYRYQLMMEQAQASNSDTMQDMIKQWTQLGFVIDKTKGKLFSFDEVIQLAAMDPTIPEVEGGLSGLEDTDGGDGGTTVIPPIIGGGGGGGVLPQPDLSPVYVPVYYYEPKPYAPPIPVPVNIPVFISGLELIPELVTGLAYIYSLIPMPVNVPVTVPGLEWIPQLQEALEGIPGLVPVNVPVTVPGFELAPSLLSYCMRLAANPFNSMVAFTIPALGLAPVLLGYLEQIAETWMSKVDISVIGQAALEKAYQLLQQVRSMLSSMGQSVVTSVQRAKQTISTGVSTAYNNAKQTVSSFGTGLAGNGNTNSILSNWAPTSAAAYGGGLLGAIKADLDLNAVRIGVKDSTKQGYTRQDINSAAAEYVGYNLNPLNKNGATNLAAKGVALSALTAAGYGALSSGAAAVGGAIESAGSGFLGSLSGAAGSAGLAMGFENGGIGTKEINNATLFEGNKAEAVIPLQTAEGIRYLSEALQEAGLSGGQGEIGEGITINLTLSGVNIADNDAQWERVGKKIAEVIDIQRQRRGELNYGSAF